MKQLFFCLSIFLLFTSCKKNEPQPKIPADTEITQKVKIFYGSYGKSSDAIYEAIPKELLSADLEKTIREVNDITNADIKKIKNSDHPTDKPKILETEGPIFTPAFTDYKIKSINLMENTKPVGMSADAVIELEDKNNPGSKWSNTVHLINTLDSGWRIDNVEFDKGNFKKTLQEFISKK
jgi:hypothetical protein